jgi:pimeloyl-ACP methyl ester carboxylesterase
MRARLALLLALLAMAPRALALDLSGTWQADGKPQRVLKVQKTAHGYAGALYNLGDEAPGAPRANTVSTISLSGAAVSFSLDKAQGDFAGRLSDDGKALAGSWKTLNGGAQPLTFTHTAKKDEWVIDPSPHKPLRVTVQPGVTLEVLDFGGGSAGPALIFLSGLGGTGHSYDGFAEKFTGRHHVYAITRRGFGMSSSPPDTDANYDADRLGDDVLAVMETLRIEKPVLAGHSIAGEELSSAGTRHPEKLAGLIYLEAVYQYSIYDPSVADLSVETATIKRDLGRMFDLQTDPAAMRGLIANVQGALPNLQQALSDTAEAMGSAPAMSGQAQKPEDLAGNRIFDNTRKYGPAKIPVLAIVAEPRQCGRNCDKPFMQEILAADTARFAYFEKQVPNARLVRIPYASHYIYRSNQADVMREMNAFMDKLPP